MSAHFAKCVYPSKNIFSIQKKNLPSNILMPAHFEFSSYRLEKIFSFLILWAQLPHKTLFHEMAHVTIGHTLESDFADTEKTPRNLREVEAEAVALLCCEALGLEGADYCRGYLQNWLYQGIGYDANAIPEKSAQKIFRAADQILRAGRLDIDQEERVH